MAPPEANNGKSLLARIRAFQKANPDNKKCADCKELGPTYICLDFQTFVCQTCSGIHREFGHKIKGISLSEWSVADVEKLELYGGNVRAAKQWLAKWKPSEFPAPDGAEHDQVREFIRKTYVDKCWWKQVDPADLPCNNRAQGSNGEVASAQPQQQQLQQQQQQGAIQQGGGSPPRTSTQNPMAAQTQVAADPAKASQQQGFGDLLGGSPTPQQESGTTFIPIQTQAATFCPSHDSTEKRPKQEPALKTCTGCQVELQTNYCGFTFCPMCSSSRQQCMICGAPATRAPATQSGATATSPSKPATAPGEQAPGLRYCSDHDASEKRPKTAMGVRVCQGCQNPFQTNYADFTFCPNCSSSRMACMLCGKPAGGALQVAGAGASAAQQRPAVAVVDMLGDLSAPSGAAADRGATWQADFNPAARTTGAIAGAVLAPPAAAAGVASITAATPQATWEPFGAPAAPAAAAAAPAPAASQEACGLFGLDFGTPEPVADDGTLGAQLRSAVLAGSADEVKRVFDAAAQVESEVTMGDKLRDAVLKGSNDEVMNLFKQVQPPSAPAQSANLLQPALGSDHFAALRTAPLSPTKATVAPSSSLCDLLGGNSPVAAQQGQQQRQLQPLLSPQELTNLDPRQLVQMQSMITQALQQRTATAPQPQPLSPPQTAAAPWATPSFSAPGAPMPLTAAAATAAEAAALTESLPGSPGKMLPGSPSAAAGPKEFGDLLGAFHSRNPIAGLKKSSGDAKR